MKADRAKIWDSVIIPTTPMQNKLIRANIEYEKAAERAQVSYYNLYGDGSPNCAMKVGEFLEFGGITSPSTIRPVIFLKLLKKEYPSN